MPQALRIDTLAFARRLKAAGADERLAEAIAEGIGTVDMSEFATKADLASLEARLMAAMADLKSDILRWMFSAMAVQTALLVALIKLI